MTNPAKTGTSPKGSATALRTLTMHDTNGIGADAPNAIIVGTTGTYRVYAKDDVASVDVYCVAGVVIPISPARILLTGSAAGPVVGLYSK